AGGDMYLFDYLGMLGIPLIPTAHFPEDAPVMLIPAQAAGDADIMKKIDAALARNARVIVTASFLAAADNDGALAKRAGLAGPVVSAPLQAERLPDEYFPGGNFNPVGEDVPPPNYANRNLDPPLDLEAPLTLDDAEILLHAISDDATVPVATHKSLESGELLVLNTHTFSQADFDAVGEVLLAPKPLGLLSLPHQVQSKIRRAFGVDYPFRTLSGNQFSVQPLAGNAGYFVHNWQDESTLPLYLNIRALDPELLKTFQDQIHPIHDPDYIAIGLKPRSRAWLRFGE
ncbi:MAG: hypothetical protein WD873_05890, partial [Candidatus Hydrogenedentales bacterium]